ncbi:ATP-grasp domain-containing protein [Candidatus Uhrbacteria bacterium]|nr:ATP-grasp domain-containing protein [Candidatus Uhrbacteria bacterium]
MESLSPTATPEPQASSNREADQYSLSAYYPLHTAYFYSFPSGEDSHFFNGVPPWKEEIVAARPMVCAGSNVRVVAFASSTNPEARDLLENHCGVPLIPSGHVITLPETINDHLYGRRRNTAVKFLLRTMLAPHALIMAQPYLDRGLEDRYQIPPALVVQLNDKITMASYVPKKFLPAQYQLFTNGRDFAESVTIPPIPCVVKISSSSAGDGVRICRTENDLRAAKSAFQKRNGNIFVEAFIPSVHNLCVQFGIPHDATKPIAIIGYNEQLIDAHGEFLGGMVDPAQNALAVKEIYTVLSGTILPAVRKMGWYGIGGIDVLVKDDGSFYFIDPNFRMTATFTYVYLLRHQRMMKSVASFTGVFRGSREEFLQQVVPLAREGSATQRMTMIALTKKDGLYRFNAGLFFDRRDAMHHHAKELLRLGIHSTVLKKLAATSTAP